MDATNRPSTPPRPEDASEAQPAEKQSGALRLFRLFGIDVWLHWSWLIVAAFELSRKNTYSSQVWNVAEYLSLFGLVLLHEFGHALACRSVGGKANRILLWPLGGVAYVEPPYRPGATLWSIVAGPLVNVVLVPVTFVLWMLADGGVLPVSPDGVTYLKQIAIINGVLLVFNLLPIYPLDGGKILRSLLWFIIGDVTSLTIATFIGMVGAAGLMALGAATDNTWLCVLAFFGGFQAYASFKESRRMAAAAAELRAIPRRAEARCPGCHQHPPVGRYWGCGCGQTLDTFAQGGVCPSCGETFDITSCPWCRAASPIEAWLIPVPVRSTLN